MKDRVQDDKGEPGDDEGKRQGPGIANCTLAADKVSLIGR